MATTHWGPDTCGCKINVSGTRFDGAHLARVPGESKKCGHHTYLKSDDALIDVVWAENRLKNEVAAEAEKLGIDVADRSQYEWEFTSNRGQLRVRFPELDVAKRLLLLGALKRFEDKVTVD